MKNDKNVVQLHVHLILLFFSHSHMFQTCRIPRPGCIALVELFPLIKKSLINGLSLISLNMFKQ